MRVFKTKSELLEIAQFVNGPSQLDLMIHLKFCTEIPNPDATLEVFAHPWPNPKALMTIVRQTYTRPWVTFYLINGGQSTDLDALLEQTSDLLEQFEEFMLWHTENGISTHVGNSLSEKFDVSSPRIPCFAFSIQPEKQRELINKDIDLPAGFSFCELNPEADHQFITDTWKYAAKTEAPNVKTKLEHLPSIGVKFDGKLVAFEMMHHSGAMNHLFTVPEFRGKGLGTAVEQKLAQKIIKMNILPFKTVSFGAPLGMSLTAKSSYWSKVVDEVSQEQIVFDFRIIYRK